MQRQKTHQGLNQNLSQQVSASGNSYLFTGRRFDNEIGMYYNRNRYYEPRNGRFVSRDPKGYVDGMNIFAYTQNDPANSLDPFGTVEVTVNVTPRWKTWSKPKAITIGGVSRSGVKGRTTIGPNIAVPLDKLNVKRTADVIINDAECDTTNNGCPKGCVRAVGRSIQLQARPLTEYLKGNRNTAIHEATHALQIGEKIKRKVTLVNHTTLCGKNAAYLILECEKQVAAKARKLIAEAIREWNTTSDSIHALEAGKHDKNPDKKYKESEVERSAREQAATGEFPAGVRPPREFR